MRIILFCLAVSSSLSADTDFGYVSSSTINIGDDVQSIAAKQFLPANAVPVDREFIADFAHDRTVNAVVSGWFMHQNSSYWDLPVPAPAQSWPPAAVIKPFFISMHLTGTFLPTVFAEANLEYLKRHAPIGARDLYTLDQLQQRGVPSYFSGCLTLTLQNDLQERSNIVYLVDLDSETVAYIRARTNAPVVELTHGRPLLQLLTVEHRLQYTKHLLNLYRRAKAVVTTRLHAAMPCLAFGTPVFMVSSETPGNMDVRFKGLVEHAHHASKQELLDGSAAYDFDNPPANPQTHVPIRNKLIERMREFVAAAH